MSSVLAWMMREFKYGLNDVRSPSQKTVTIGIMYFVICLIRSNIHIKISININLENKRKEKSKERKREKKNSLS